MKMRAKAIHKFLIGRVLLFFVTTPLFYDTPLTNERQANHHAEATRVLPQPHGNYDLVFEQPSSAMAHPDLRLTHRKATRTTNLRERLFGEERRRSKVIPHAFGERAVMKLMLAALLCASESWRGIRVTEFELRQLQLLRNELNEQFGARHAAIAQPINPASCSRISSNRGT
jgi:hypothetical protein